MRKRKVLENPQTLAITTTSGKNLGLLLIKFHAHHQNYFIFFIWIQQCACLSSYLRIFFSIIHGHFDKKTWFSKTDAIKNAFFWSFEVSVGDNLINLHYKVTPLSQYFHTSCFFAKHCLHRTCVQKIFILFYQNVKNI